MNGSKIFVCAHWYLKKEKKKKLLSLLLLLFMFHSLIVKNDPSHNEKKFNGL